MRNTDTPAPGPWETSVLCSADTRSIEIVLPERDYEVIAVVCGTGEESQATAALIESAPDLLAALEGLFEHCAMVHRHWGDGDNTAPAAAAQAAGRAAIAKARGES